VPAVPGSEAWASPAGPARPTRPAFHLLRLPQLQRRFKAAAAGAAQQWLLTPPLTAQASRCSSSSPRSRDERRTTGAGEHRGSRGRSERVNPTWRKRPADIAPSRVTLPAERQRPTRDQGPQRPYPVRAHLRQRSPPYQGPKASHHPRRRDQPLLGALEVRADLAWLSPPGVALTASSPARPDVAKPRAIAIRNNAARDMAAQQPSRPEQARAPSAAAALCEQPMRA
jgi:hypothetical protein